MTAKLYRFHGFTLDIRSRRLQSNNISLPLSSKAYEILLYLIKRKGEIVEKKELLEEVWRETFVEEANLPVHISALRRVLNERKGESRFIKTIPGKGYCFIADVEKISGENHRPDSPETNPDDKTAKPVSIAVLPFEFTSQKSADEYIETSLTQSIIHDLSNLKPLKILSFSAIKKYKNSDSAPDEIGFLLGVDRIIKGYLSTAYQKITINVEIIDALDNSIIWGNEWTVDSENVFNAKNEITSGIVQSLKDIIHKSLEKSPQMNPQAQKTYYRGKYISETRGSRQNPKEALQKALDFFRESVKLEPNYALAYVGIGSVYVSLYNHNLIEKEIACRKSKQSAQKAIETDESLSEAYVLNGSIEFMFDNNFRRAEKSFDLAVLCNPNNPDGYHWKSLCLLCRGNFAEAIECSLKAIELDFLSLRYNEQLLRIFYYAGEFQKAIIQAEEILSFDKNSVSSKLFSSLAYAQSGLTDIALDYINEAIAFCDLSSLLSYKVQILCFADRHEEAKKIIEEIEIQKINIDNYDFAVMYAAVKDADTALDYLSKAVAEKRPNLNLLKIDSAFETLRFEKKFRSILSSIGFE